MFTREPYSKLLSGYIDKLFAPNPYFWNVIGRFIIQKFRKYPSLRSLECGHDVTFTGRWKNEGRGVWWTCGMDGFLDGCLDGPDEI